MSLTFNEYQERAGSTAIYPQEYKVLYPVLGLCGEAGEVAEKVKKIYRDKGGKMTPVEYNAIQKELGDVLWYLAAIANDIGTNLGEIAANNLEKLDDRARRGVLQGSGDSR